tara:strand:- start:22706 stop:22924 length:219 start_codon:yes stop_codon:yes gene_type:complete
MTQDIIRMAREAHGRTTGEWWDMDVAALKRFAELARADEREQCAKLVEGLFDDPNDSVLEFIVDAIRARGQA